jgi:hypothetical protein
MRSRAAAWAVVLALCGAGVVLPAAAGTHAGLVVDTGSRATTYCVALDATSVSGLRLIELASSQYGLQYSLGFGGKAVCQLSGVGPSGDDCFGDYPYFWGYWRDNGSGGWTWSGTGAASTSISDGDVDGWTWGTGDSGSTHPPPPALGFGDVCRSSIAPPSPSPSASKKPTPGSGAGTETGSSIPSVPSAPDLRASESAGPGRTPRSSPSGGASGVAPSPSAARSVVALARPGRPPDGSGSGPPLGALLALGAILGLGAAGVLRLRRGPGSTSPPRP